MRQDPFYVKDSMSSQFDNEDKIRKQKRMDFMEQQKKRLFRIFANERQ